MWPPRQGPQVGVLKAPPASIEGLHGAVGGRVEADLLGARQDDAGARRGCTLRPRRMLGRLAQVLEAAVGARADHDLVDA